MSLLDSAKSQFDSGINSVKKVANSLFNSTNVTYGFIGVSTVILSYYTFFEKDIEAPPTEEPTKQNVDEQPLPVDEQLLPVDEQPLPVDEPPAPVDEQPLQVAEPPQNGGKKHKKTRKHK
jgi:type IV secretory pathway VirB10-like protein